MIYYDSSQLFLMLGYLESFDWVIFTYKVPQSCSDIRLKDWGLE